LAHVKTVAYAESHDQALVGDQTLAFRLMNDAMYWHMTKDDPDVVVDRGMALHKMIRLFTIVLGGDAYMNFMGNEFGHPEWIDFPRDGNNWSYQYSRRQWSLVDNPELKYAYLATFDRDMLAFIKANRIMGSLITDPLNMDDTNKTLVFERNHRIFIFNFHPTNAIPDYRFWVPQAGSYRLVLNSDDAKYGGHGRIDPKVTYTTSKEDGQHFLRVYNTNRTALVLQRVTTHDG
jgi:1,4-alpha-glucan branching enzyme